MREVKYIKAEKLPQVTQAVKLYSQQSKLLGNLASNPILLGSMDFLGSINAGFWTCKAKARHWDLVKLTNVAL